MRGGSVKSRIGRLTSDYCVSKQQLAKCGLCGGNNLWLKGCNRDYSELVGPERRSKLAERSLKAYDIAAVCSGTTSTLEVI